MVDPSEDRGGMAGVDMDAEASILGALLLDSTRVDEASALLRSDDFHSAQHRMIWEAILAAREAGGPVDVETVAEALKRAGKWSAAGGAMMIGGLALKVLGSSKLTHHMRVVADASCVRQLAAFGAALRENAAEVRPQLADDVAAFCQDASDGLKSALERQASAAACVTMAQAIEQADAFDAKPEAHCYPSGLTDLDGIIHGFRDGSFYVIGARPGAAKSTMLLNVALNMAERGVPCSLVSLEMPAREIASRALAQRERGRLARLPLDIHSPGRMTTGQLRAFARERHRRKRCSVLLVDYLQLVSVRRAENRLQEVSAVSRELKAIALDLDIPVIAAAQLNREAIGEPSLTHLRESGQIEADADVVALLWVPLLEGRPIDGQLLAKIAKNRNGGTGRVKLAWRAAYYHLDDLRGWAGA